MCEMLTNGIVFIIITNCAEKNICYQCLLTHHTWYCLLFISCCIKVCCKSVLLSGTSFDLQQASHGVTLCYAHIWLSIHDFLTTFITVIFVSGQCFLQNILFALKKEYVWEIKLFSFILFSRLGFFLFLYIMVSK